VTILVVEDDRSVREALDRALRAQGYEVVVADDALTGLQLVHHDDPALVILDLGLPGMDGLSLCRRLRADGDQRPILILTARDGVDDRVQGLDVGADDYLVKPFALEELLARVRALLRRSEPDPDPRLRLGALVIDPDGREVRYQDSPIELTDLEFRLLLLLTEHARVVLTREQLLQRLWEGAEAGSENALEVYIGYLRRKLSAAGAPELIHTVRGVGYVLRPSP
jgi:two-component system response regulator MprA